MGCLFSKRRVALASDAEGDEDADADADRYKFVYGNPLNSAPNINRLIQMHEEPGDNKMHI
jgi:hypothetical protein